jgi:uncharacterized protein (TIGR00369 family)
MTTDFFMDDKCFACGTANKNGLHLAISETQDGVTAVIDPPLWTQGYKRTVHGGIIATILDEMTVWAAYMKKNAKCVTAELNIRIRHAMSVDNEYIARAKVLQSKHQLIITYAEIIDSNGMLMASAQAKLMQVSE